MTHPAHLNARDRTIARVSRAPQPDLERQEEWEDSPEGYPQTAPEWVSRHDEYDVSAEGQAGESS